MISGAGAGATPRSSAVVRTRLTDRLARRFQVRVTLLTGGSGSGKTTSLAHAIAAEDKNIDVWYPCTAADRRDAHLLAGLEEASVETLALKKLPKGAASSNRLGEMLLAISPRQVCLILDDAHLLSRTVVDELTTSLPENAHLLVSGRASPTFGSARLDAAGQLVEIAQDELLMTDDEQIEFANLRGVDVAVLAGAEGWPAFVELASTGTEARSRRYLEEEAVRDLAPQRRSQLAAFSYVGGGDDEVSMAVAGVPIEDLLKDIPLVRWTGDTAVLHDLWGVVLDTELDAATRRGAALKAAKVFRNRREFQRALDLCLLVDADSELVLTIEAALRRGVDGGMHRDDLEDWATILKAHAAESPIALLVNGLIERESDSTSTRLWECLDDAALGFNKQGDAELELFALGQLGYAAKCRRDSDAIARIMSRIEALSARHPPAASFLAFGEAWTALTSFDPEAELAAMLSIANADLPLMWQITRDHLQANALITLGRASEALDVVPKDMGSLPVPIPGSLTTEAECYWQAGMPDKAIRLQLPALASRHGLRDQYLALAWRSRASAMSGDVAAAEQWLAAAREIVVEQIGPIDAMMRPGLVTLIDAAKGRQDVAAGGLRKMLEIVPLGQGVSEQLLVGNVAFVYTLLPEARQFWDDMALGPDLDCGREIARAFTSARERGDLGPITRLDWPSPGAIAAHLPTNWAIEFALYGVKAKREEGRHVADWLCEHWGDPARKALRSWTSDATLGEHAIDVLANTPTPPGRDVAFEVLGQTRLKFDGHECRDSNWRRERVRAMLTFLVLNPVTTRDQLAGTLWPDLTSERAHKNLRTTLNYLHNVLEPRRAPGDAAWFVRITGQQVRFHQDSDVDLWQFRTLLEAADEAERNGSPNVALPLLTEAASLWKGDVGSDFDFEWLELERIHIRSQYVRASCRAAELLVATSRPAEAAKVAKATLSADPWHAASYSVLAEAYQALGDATGARAVDRLAEERRGITIR